MTENRRSQNAAFTSRNNALCLGRITGEVYFYLTDVYIIRKISRDCFYSLVYFPHLPYREATSLLRIIVSLRTVMALQFLIYVVLVFFVLNRELGQKRRKNKQF